jgi:(p)ppGpp synthase/HD superfamily hydrolase
MKNLLDDMGRHHAKQLTYMRGMLDGKGWYKAWSALELARGLEVGFRKDGCTPKFHHELQVARLAATLLPHLIHPEETVAACFLHDLREDHPKEVDGALLAAQFGPLVADAVWALSKKSGGLTKDYDTYFADLARNPIASVVKLCDRAHNLHTMQGVWSPEKQRAYAEEIDRWFFPLIKEARHNFPRQYAAYENLKILLLTQYQMLYYLVGQCPDADAPKPPKEAS